MDTNFLNLYEHYMFLFEELSKDALYDRVGGNMDRETFDELVSLDPTSEGEYVGKYVNWILKLYNKNKLGDTDEIMELLYRYDNMDRSKLVRKNINKYNSVEDLKSIIFKGSDDKERSDEVVKDDVTVHYKDEDWVIETANNHEASCNAYGKFTSWCTASKEYDQDFYEDYTTYGSNLYVIRKVDRSAPLAQIFVEKIADDEIPFPVEISDKRNKPFDLKKFFKKYPKIADFFKKIVPQYFEYEQLVIQIKNDEDNPIANKVLYYNKDDNDMPLFKDIVLESMNLSNIPEDLKKMYPYNVERKGQFFAGTNSFKSLEYSPITTGTYYVECDPTLSSLKGSPEEVYGDFWIYGADALSNLEGGPKIVEGSYNITSCGDIENLVGMPEVVGGMEFEYTYISSLEGFPKEVKGNVDITVVDESITKETINKISNVHGKIFLSYKKNIKKFK